MYHNQGRTNGIQTNNNKTTNTMNTIYNTLNALKGNNFIAVATLTEAKMNKRNNPLAGRVMKLTESVYQFGYSYENAVNNRLEKQGDERTFTTDSLPWGNWIVPNKFIAHNCEIYVRFYTAANNQPKITYFVDNRLATAEEIEIIKAFTPAPKESAKQAAHGLTENQVKPMAINLKNILKIKINGEEIVASETEPATSKA